MVIALSLILISFEWTSNPPLLDDIAMVKEIDVQEQMISIKREEPPKEEIEPEVPDIVDVIEIVDDDEDVEGWTFDPEVDPSTVYYFGFDEDDEEDLPDDMDFVIVEDMPTFNGGEPSIEFRKYIAKNMKYPEIAAQNGVSGKVLVQFVVNSKGKVVDAVVIRSVDPALDQEALRVITASPTWEAGKQRGKSVRVIFSFPINFVLQ